LDECSFLDVGTTQEEPFSNDFGFFVLKYEKTSGPLRTVNLHTLIPQSSFQVTMRSFPEYALYYQTERQRSIVKENTCDRGGAIVALRADCTFHLSVA
jgi:hypothetical protein